MLRTPACAVATVVALFGMGLARAQQTDVTQTPNKENAGIQKSLEEEVGVGRGAPNLPDSSRYIIERDPFRAIARGRVLFQRKFTVAQGLGPRIHDGIDSTGNPSGGLSDNNIVAGFADSCAGCHSRPRSSAGSGGNVFTRPDSRDTPHLFGLGVMEMLGDEITSDLRALRAKALTDAKNHSGPVTVHLMSKNIDYGALTAFPDGHLDTSAVSGVDTDLRVKPFFAEGSTFSIRAFTVGALQAEMGLQSPDPDLLLAHNGGRSVTPSGMVLDGSLDVLPAPLATTPQQDVDGDGVVNEIDPALVDYLEFYLLNYFRPATYRTNKEQGKEGRKLLSKLGCVQCHVPDLTINHDRRVADVDTAYDPTHGIFNHLFATATDHTQETVDDPSLPPLRAPEGGKFVVHDIFTDLRRHDLGSGFWERNFDGTLHKQFMTRALWGVGSTAPYGHDGRSINLTEVILRHGGEAGPARDRFAALSDEEQKKVLDFLETLVLFPPQDTASNLNPGNHAALGFPQRGHGSVDLSVLFNVPGDPE